jgi:hypothetical protein
VSPDIVGDSIMKLFPALAVALTVTVSSVSAQMRPAPGPELTGLPPGEIVAIFDAYVLVQAQSMLSLDDEHAARFIVKLKALQEVRRTNQRSRQRIVGELMRLVRPDAKSEEAAIREQLKMLTDHDARTASEIAKAYAGVDEVLDVRQQARFRVFEEQMERRKFEFLNRARQQNRPKGSRPPA